MLLELDVIHDLVELERLLDDVIALSRLDLACLDRGAATVPLRVTSVSIALLLEKSISRFRAQGDTHVIETDIPSQIPPVEADEVLLGRVVDNLLENARKYSDPGTTVALRVEPLREHLRVTVADTGIGIPQEDLERVVVPFFRSDRSRARASGGVGLGLAFVSRIVSAHGGTLQIDSAPGKGTSVAFSLPLRPQ